MPSEALFNPENLTILVVDDHDPIRKGIRRIALSMGFSEIVECFDGEDALKVLQEKPVDLVILDLFMRTVSGFDVLEQIRNRDLASDIPIIVVTGEASKDEIVRVADMGADDYVLKPFQANDFEAKVIKTLNKFYSPPPLLKAIRRAERFFVAEDFPKALQAFDKALEIDADSARAAHGKALTLARTGDDEQAVRVILDALRKNHSYHKLYGALANLYLRRNHVKDAIEAFRRELSINPKQPSRQTQLARLLLKEGDPMGAMEHFRTVLQDDPKHAIALMGMGQAFATADNLDKALYYFKRVRRYHPGNSKSLDFAVRACFAAGDPKKAEIFLKDERQAHPDKIDSYILLVQLLLKQDRDDEAFTVAGDLMAREPENGHAFRLKAMVLMKRQDYAGALAALDEAAKIAPSGEIFCAIAEACIAAKKFAQACEAAAKAITLAPTSAWAFTLLAEGHQNVQQWLKAAILYKKAIALGGNREQCLAEIKDCLGRANGRRKQRLGIAS